MVLIKIALHKQELSLTIFAESFVCIIRRSHLYPKYFMKNHEILKMANDNNLLAEIL